MLDPQAYDRAARENLGSAYTAYLAMPTVGRSGYRCDPPILTVKKTDDGGAGRWSVVIEVWWEDRLGWDVSSAAASDASYATWGEAQAALTAMFPRSAA